MRRRLLRDLRPALEPFEPRALLSAITDVMAGNSLASFHGALDHLAQGQTGTSARGGSGFVPSGQSIAIPSNQGPQGLNLALTPTGTLTPQEQKREQFVAVFQGPYTIGPGRTSTEAMQTVIRAAGTSNTMRHCDIQLNIITPKDPSLPISGVSAIFDRNLNSNTVLGFDFSAPIQNVDNAGRPNNFNQVSIDVNISAGVYVEAFAQGTINIRYRPSGVHTPGVLDQGTAIVTIRAQIYGIGVAFILANSGIDP